MYVVQGTPRLGSQLQLRSHAVFGLPVAPPPQVATPSMGVVTLSGNSPATRQRATLSIATSTLSGVAVARGRWRIAVPTASVILSGLAPTTSGTAKALPTPGVISLTGMSFGGIPVWMPVPFKSIALSGLPPFKLRYRAIASQGVITLSGLAPVRCGLIVKPNTGRVNLSGMAPVAKRGAQCSPGIIYLYGLATVTSADWEAEDCTIVIIGQEACTSVTPPAEAPVTMSFVPKETVR